MSGVVLEVDKHLVSLLNVIFMFLFFSNALFALAICLLRLAAYQFSNVNPCVCVPWSEI